MEFLNKNLNDLKNSTKSTRCNGYKKLHALVEAHKCELSQQQSFEVIRSCIVGFEDSSERCREEAVVIATLLLDTQDHIILDWVLPAVVTRIGLEKTVEDSEEIRLLLLRLACKCMTCFPHEIGPRKFIDFFLVLLTNCYSDNYPELKKEACRATIQLCTIEPKEVTSIAVPLGKALKVTCLGHKHAAVRCEGVRTFARLIKCGAAELLTQGKMEPDNATTEFNLFVLANDHSESVRLAVLEVVSTALMDVRNRLEHHRVYLPHLLLLATDSFRSVRDEALSALECLGKLYMLDQEDNRLDISKRPVSMKDIEWYADDDYANMTTLREEVTQRYPILCRRPSLGTRYVVAESARNFLKKILLDVKALDWIIPYSTNNRKAVALRILWTLIFHCEKNSVQFAEEVLGAVYKALRDENTEVVVEASFCVEILGKFLTPDQYLPFMISRNPTGADGKNKASDDDDTITHKTKNKTVVLTSAEGTEQKKMPSLFSTEAATVKCSILLSIGFLVAGSKHLLLPTHASQLTQALTSIDTLDCESEELLLSLLIAYDTIIKVFAERKFIATKECPLPAEIQDNPQQRTIDSIFLYALLVLKGSPFPSVRNKAQSCAEMLSNLVTGKPNGIYDLHVRRILFRYGSTLPVQAFSDLVLFASHKTALGDDLLRIFIARLGDINFKLNVTEELRYFGVLEQLLWDQSFRLSTTSVEELLRVIILPLCAFNASSVASLFRKIAVNCLCAVSSDLYREPLQETLDKDNSLGSKIVDLWSSASDSEDSEMRLVCATAIVNMAQLPMSEGTADEMIQSIILRLDDTSDLIRLRAVHSLSLAVMSPSDLKISSTFIKEIRAKIVPLTKKLLLFLDDQEETVGLRPVIEQCIKYLGLLSPDIVMDLVKSSLSKHLDPVPCQNILEFVVESG